MRRLDEAPASISNPLILAPSLANWHRNKIIPGGTSTTGIAQGKTVERKVPYSTREARSTYYVRQDVRRPQ